MISLNVGIIGFGRIGAEHAQWLSRCSGIRAAAVMDQTRARQELAVSRGLKVYSSLSEILNDKAIDVILISTPTAMHFEHARAALQAGKHVMVEKPMTLDLPTSKKLVALAKKRGLVLSVFHNRRWDIDYLHVKQAITSKRFGRIINIESRLGQFSSCVGPAAKEYRPGWRNEASFGGGGLYDWGSHLVDQIQRLFYPSKPLRVFAQLRGNIWTRDCDDFARMLIDFDNGSTALIEINTTTSSPLPRWHIDGTLGSAQSPFSLAFDTHQWAQLNFTSAGKQKKQIIPIDDKTRQMQKSESDIWNQFAKAVASMKGKKQILPAVPAESVLPTMWLLDAARRSSKTGKAVEFKGQVEWDYD